MNYSESLESNWISSNISKSFGSNFNSLRASSPTSCHCPSLRPNFHETLGNFIDGSEHRCSALILLSNGIEKPNCAFSTIRSYRSKHLYLVRSEPNLCHGQSLPPVTEPMSDATFWRTSANCQMKNLSKRGITSLAMKSYISVIPSGASEIPELSPPNFTVMGWHS